MKVIFIKELKKQGHVNDIKEVSDGYAVNYLIKNGYAVKYTKASSDILKKDIKMRTLEDNKLREDALALKEKLEKIDLEFFVKSNGGKMFGSISSKQIVDGLLMKNISVDKRNVEVNGLDTLGMHEVKIKLYKNIVAVLRVHILAE